MQQIIGNKSDMSHKRAVSTEEAQRYADEQGVLYIETSAKSAAGVEEAFMRTVAGAWQRAANGQLPLRDADVRATR